MIRGAEGVSADRCRHVGRHPAGRENVSRLRRMQSRENPGGRAAAGDTELARQLTRLSADEMVSALGLARAPGWVRRPAALPFLALSRPLARILARFDHDIGARGLPAAATEALAALGASLVVSARPPSRGPLLVLANHPGAYDAFALMAAVGRPDLAILAADRSFLRALPALARHLVFVPDGPLARVASLRRAMAHLREGRALLHFPAGRIEPDPAFAEGSGAGLLAPWMPGTDALVRVAGNVGGSVVAASVSGVHSPRAKRSLVNRLAERRGVTTLAPLLQLAVRLRDVRAEVRFSEARSAAPASDGEDVAAALRRALLALCEEAAAGRGPG